MTPEEWAIYKLAVKEYSRLRPRLVYEAAWTPTYDVKLQALPTGVFGVEQIVYGVEEDFLTVVNAESDQGWALNGNLFALTPAPESPTTIQVIWRAFHTTTDDPQTTSVPKDDEYYVEQLATAIELEQKAQGILSGPLKYAIGQRLVDRSAAPSVLNDVAAALRSEVFVALSQPLVDWG